jgi:hypothetical protein
MRILGKTTQGVYHDPIHDPDDCYGMSPEDIQLFYGVTRTSERSHYASGAGHLLDEMSDGDSDWDDIGTDSGSDSEDEEIMDDIRSNIRHDAIRPPKAHSPLSDSGKDIFIATLTEVLRNQDAPHGFGLYDNECDGGYPDSELIPAGRRGSRRIEVRLPVHIWQPRAVVWVQALRTMDLVVQEPMHVVSDSSDSDSDSG